MKQKLPAVINEEAQTVSDEAIAGPSRPSAENPDVIGK